VGPLGVVRGQSTTLKACFEIVTSSSDPLLPQ